MSLAFSPDSTKLLSGSRGQKVGNGFQFGAAPSSRVWDMKTGAIVKQYDSNPAGLGGCWLADGKRAVARNSNQTAVVVWDTETGQELSALDRDLPAVEHLSLSAGDKYVAAGLGNSVVLVWELNPAKRIHRFEPAGVPAFTPDATRLVCSTASHGPLARVFDLATGGEIAKTEQRLADNVGHSWVFPAGDRALLSTYQSAHVYTIPLPGVGAISAPPLVPPPGAANSPPAGSLVYLDDLQEASWEGAALAKHGMRAVSEAGWSQQAMSWLGRKPAHSLFTHPRSYSSAWLTYALDGRYDEFRATVGMLAKPTSQLVFCVYGDDIRLWQSTAITESQKGTEFTVKVRGVKTLKLEVHCPSAFTNAQAVWIDPRLTVAR